MVIWDYFETALAGGQWSPFNWAASKARARFLLGTAGGFDLRGKMVLERQASNPGGSAVALDFGAAQCMDLSPFATNISFFTTNRTEQGTNYEQRIFILRGGADGFSTSWPAGWSWLSAVPARVTNGTLVRLQLESLGPGPTNVLARAEFAPDMRYGVGTKASIPPADVNDPAIARRAFQAAFGRKIP